MNSDAIRTSAELHEARALPCAGVIHADPTAPATAEKRPLPAALSRTPVEDISPAQWAYERLILYINNFEEQLDAEHEIAMGFTGAEAGVLRIEGSAFSIPTSSTFMAATKAEPGPNWCSMSASERAVAGRSQGFARRPAAPDRLSSGQRPAPCGRAQIPHQSPRRDQRAARRPAPRRSGMTGPDESAI